MKVQISVKIDREGPCCGVKCPYFSIETGVDIDKPVVEWCRLFKRQLEAYNTDVYRCEECIAKDTVYLRELRMLQLRAIHKSKPKALELLEMLNYRFSFYDFNTLKELVTAILKTKRVTKEQLMDIISISESEFDSVMEGKEYPYVLNSFRMAIGFPKPVELDDYERKLATAALLNKHRD